MRTTNIMIIAASILALCACTVNPATGDKQFTAFMSTQQEVSIGEQEHEKIMAMFGEYNDPKLSEYVGRIGKRVVQGGERTDTEYHFTVLDTPMVNAFALPGGYIYVSRGLLQQANSEAELAAVIAHESGHINARHSAERYSHAVLASLGTSALAAAVDSNALSQVTGIGSELYIKSYSRSQEHEADKLGVRYLYKAGYRPEAMASFLTNLGQYTAFENEQAGISGKSQYNYLSTHPQTSERIDETIVEATQYPENRNVINREVFMKAINGTVYGDSQKHGFVKDNSFFHPDIGFTFSVPEDFKIINQTDEVIASGPDGAIMIFDSAKVGSAMSPVSYLTQVWMRSEELRSVESIMINGMDASTAAFDDRINGRPMIIRIIAIEWEPGKFFRFQMGIPRDADSEMVNELKRTTYSFKRMSEEEKKSITPYKLRIVKAYPEDTVARLSQNMASKDLKEERFRVINALKATEEVIPGELYKVVAE